MSEDERIAAITRDIAMFTVNFVYHNQTIALSGEPSIVLDAISRLVGHEVEVRDNPSVR